MPGWGGYDPQLHPNIFEVASPHRNLEKHIHKGYIQARTAAVSNNNEPNLKEYDTGFKFRYGSSLFNGEKGFLC